jgi:hypothetical protein
VNAISQTATLQQAAESTSRELEILWRLIDLSMELAELTAREIRELAAARPEQAKTEPPGHKRTDPRVIFLRFDRAIRDTVTLIKRLAVGALPQAAVNTPRPKREAAPCPTPEPAAIEAPNAPEDFRRPHIIRYLREANELTRHKRKKPITNEQIEESVNAELAKDPSRRLQGRFILLKVCKSLGLPYYANQLHADLFRPPQPTTPAPIAAP